MKSRPILPFAAIAGIVALGVLGWFALRKNPAAPGSDDASLQPGTAASPASLTAANATPPVLPDLDALMRAA